MKVALVYDHVNKIGGAERILVALHELYPEAPIYTTVYNKPTTPWTKTITIVPSFLQKFPLAKKYHELYSGLPIFAFETMRFTEYDVVISVTAGEAKGVITSPDTLHICYCLTPTRYLWSHYADYFSNRFFAVLSLPLVVLLRMWDALASIRPDTYVAISNEVRKRIQKYYHRNAMVIYPPVETTKFKVQSSKFKVKKANYYLCVSRLVRYKRLDIAIEACNRLRLPLKIVGEGLDRKRLEKMAGPTIEFLGDLTDEELIGYYQNCRALLFPQEEDFGIVAVEALSCGRPVFAYHGGGATEIIQAGITGDFFYPQTAQALVRLLHQTQKKAYNMSSCRLQAERFSKIQFKNLFSAHVTKEWENFSKGERV